MGEAHTPRRTTWRRHALWIPLASILVGLAINAWVIWTQTRSGPRGDLTVMQGGWHAPVPDAWPDGADSFLFTSFGATVRLSSINNQTGFWWVATARAGFPLKSFECTWGVNRDPSPELPDEVLHSHFVIPAEFGGPWQKGLPGVGEVGRIPIRPRPVEFVINLLAWIAAGHAVWFVLTTIGRRARAIAWRFTRARRGLCVRCAYDLSGVPAGTCPECGHAFENTIGTEPENQIENGNEDEPREERD